MDQCFPNHRSCPRLARLVSPRTPSTSFLPMINTFSSGSIAAAGLNMAKYYQTENDMNGTQPLWSPSTFTWPNYLTIAAASVTFVSSSAVLLAYCWGREAAERFDNRRALISKLILVVQVLVKVVASATAAIVMYKTGSSSNSLTGQTCGAPPAKAPMFPQLNFDTYCLRQVYPLLPYLYRICSITPFPHLHLFGWTLLPRLSRRSISRLECADDRILRMDY